MTAQPDVRQTINIRLANADEWRTLQRLNAQVFENDAPHDDDLDLDWPYSAAGILIFPQQ